MYRHLMLIGAIFVSQEMAGMDMSQSIPTLVSPVFVSINPEARVSVKTIPSITLDCSKALEIGVHIHNDSKSRAVLHVASLTEGVVISKQPAPQLSGAIDEERNLTVVLSALGKTDINLGFDLGPGTQDLARRGEGRFLLSCLARPVGN